MKDYIPKPGERVEAAARLVERCEKLLDVGCGDGAIQNFIAGRVRHTYGVDSSKKMLKKSAKRGLKVKYVDLDDEEIPFKKNYFDTITCLDVIEHVRNPKDLLEKIYRVLKRMGDLL